MTSEVPSVRRLWPLTNRLHSIPFDSFLHFIFSDKKSNDIQLAKYRVINRNHRLAYLPQILHEYDHMLSEKLDDKPEDSVQYFKHSDIGDLKLTKNSFDEYPTLRSDSDLNGKAETKINKLYSGLGIKKYDSHQEEEELTRLKSILIENYRSRELTKVQSVTYSCSMSFSFHTTVLLFRKRRNRNRSSLSTISRTISLLRMKRS